ncbi:hypothetical protein VaNZ11_003560 [Volvox africanus]|uniref:Retrotransposon gag domain-containing protein n=1 Tax=Volvox africanus TaxID=51714 RepID=A0ABQ5RW47_9CHLO|nr:hypothetical protein VaNZ11_003560 [Volvox africanus]
MKLTIPVPKLNISADEKAKNSGHSVADRTRAYVRDARQYLQAVHGGGCDSIKCLFVGNTLEGVAKDWYDEWTTARDKYTFDNLIDALLARFATEVRSRGNEARKMLAQGTYHMRPHETVPAYQSRFEALITPIVNFPEEDRIFWFHHGLTESLARWCATDLSGIPFQSYDALVAFARGAEVRHLAGKDVKQFNPRVHVM